MSYRNMPNYVDLVFSPRPELDPTTVGDFCASKLGAACLSAGKPGVCELVLEAMKQPLRTYEAEWRKPLEWAKQAHPYRPRALCELPSYVGEGRSLEHFSRNLHGLIGSTPSIDWLLVSQGIHTIMEFSQLGPWPQANAWVGLKAWVYGRGCFAESIQTLLDAPAAKRVLIVDVDSHDLRVQSGLVRPLDWVICSARSGDYSVLGNLRYLRNKCATCGVPFWFAGWRDSVPDRDGVFRPSSELTGANAVDRYSLDGALHRGTPFVH